MSISASFKRAIETVRRRRRHRRAVNNLLGLDDRMLADLGLHRCEVRSAVIEAHDADAPRERRHGRVGDPTEAGAATASKRDEARQARWEGAAVRPVRPADSGIQSANDPNRPRRRA